MTAHVFHLIPHTHWDREWHLPRGAIRARLVPMMDELIHLLERDTGFRTFLLDGQTVIVEDYLRVRPERTDAVRALVAAGRLQVGPWYVLADEQIPSGEALVRNLLLGMADAERLGHRLDVLYSPDAFGHPAAWPALAREFGMVGGVLWRGFGGEHGHDGDRFRWRAPDGRDVLVWHLPPQGYEIGAALPADRARLPEAWAAVRATLVARARGPHVPVFVGADHHHAHPAISKLRDLLEDIEGANTVRVSRLDDFFRAAADPGAPVIEGARRWSYGYTWTLQGTHGTRAPLKRRNSMLELWLEREAEPLAALARRGGGRDRRPLLDAAWRTLVRGQFHDTICGTTSDAVAVAAAARLDDAAALAREIVRGSVHELAGHDPDVARTSATPSPGALLLWNPAARPRGGVAVCDVTFLRSGVPVGPPSGAPRRAGAGAQPFALAGPDGAIPVQVLGRRAALERIDAARHYPMQDAVDVVRVAFRAPALPGLGVAALRPAAPAALPAADGVRVEARSIVNRHISVALEHDGGLTLTDRETGARFSGVLRLESSGDAGDTYTYCPPERDRTTRATGPIAVRRVAAGPLVAALESRFRVPCGTRGRVDARLTVMLHAGSPVVRCILSLDNRATWHRLRARVPTGLSGTPAVAGSAFTSVTRPALRVAASRYPLETPVATAPAHRFVAVAGAARGLAVLAPGFFEYELTAAGDVVVTLLRAVGELSRGDLPARPGHAAWPTPTPLAQCPGHDRVELALVAVSREQVDRGDTLAQHWEDVFLPPRGFWIRDAGDVAPPTGGIALEGAGLVVSALKPAQAGTGLVLRCYNATNRPAAGAWRIDAGVRAAYRVRADERESVPLVLEDRGRAVRFKAGPHEIVTVMVE